MICRKETITYKAKPKIYNIDKSVFYILNQNLSAIQNLNFIIKGNFLQISNVYLSANNNLIFNQNHTFYNNFSGIKTLSAKNVPFYGIKLNNFSFSENFLTFEFPNIPKTIGYVDVVVENEAGYSLLTKETKIVRQNPCENVTDFQKPCSQGIQIKNS